MEIIENGFPSWNGRLAVYLASLAGNDAEAVVLDFVQPLAARRKLVGFGWKVRCNMCPQLEIVAAHLNPFDCASHAFG